MYYQQGDVLIKKIDQVPERAEPVKTDSRGRLVLAHGEATGHTHAIEEPQGVRLYTQDEILYLEVERQATVLHPEHRPIDLPPGRYQIGRAREFDYRSHEARSVRD